MSLPPAESPPEPAGLCATCHTRLYGPYCYLCGERMVKPSDFTLRRYLAHAVDAVWHVDGKLWRTFRALIFQPGVLTAEYFRGRRQPYLRPFAVFLVVNVIYFLLTPSSLLTTPLSWYLQVGARPVTTATVESVADRIGPPAADRTEFAKAIKVYSESRGARVAEPSPALAALQGYGRTFDARSSLLARSLVVVMIPLLAAFAMLLHFRWRRNQPFVKHLVFATHFLAVLLLVSLASELLAKWTRRLAIALDVSPVVAFMKSADRIFVPVLMVVFLYCFRALRELHGSGRVAAGIRAALLAGGLVIPFLLYRWVLFLAAYHTT